jgi:hypothetical protein
MGFHANSLTLFGSAVGNGSAHALSAGVWTAGDYWEFHVSTLDFVDLQLSFAQRSDNNGPTNFTLAYSLNHTTFTTIGPSFFQVRADNSGGAWNTSTPNADTIRTFDLSATNVLENVPDVYFRLSAPFGNPSGASRIDDFAVIATAVPEPAVATLGITAIAIALSHRRRTLR